MKKDDRMKLGWLLLAVALPVLLVAIGCGKKADPVPPSVAPPAPVSDLEADLEGSRVTLTWRQLAAAKEIGVFRSRVRLEEPACSGCPMMFERIAGNAVVQGTTYSTELEQGYRYHFKVRVSDAYGQTADSNTVQVVF